MHEEMTGVGVPGEELALLRQSHDRSLGSEGIPMVLALVDERGTPPVVTDEAVVADGAQLAERMERLGAALSPSGRDGDVGRLIMVLQAAAYADFGTAAAQR